MGGEGKAGSGATESNMGQRVSLNSIQNNIFIKAKLNLTNGNRVGQNHTVEKHVQSTLALRTTR